MPHECSVCGKKTQFGKQYTRRGLAKKYGGNGRKVTGKTRRTFKPNLQRIRVFENGHTTRKLVCTQCIRAGKIQKPPKQSQRIDDARLAGKLPSKTKPVGATA